MDYELVVIGASWGGLHAVGSVLDGLGDASGAAIVVAQHRGVAGGERLAPLLQRRTQLRGAGGGGQGASAGPAWSTSRLPTTTR